MGNPALRLSEVLRNVRLNFIFANSVKDIFATLKITTRASVNDRVILPFREGFISRNFAK